MPRRSYAGAAQPTALTGDFTAIATSFTVTNGAGYPDGVAGPFFLVLARGKASEEKVLATARSGNIFTIPLANRGQDGTSIQSHPFGTTVEHVFTATDADEANAHNNDLGDPHPRYAERSRLAINVKDYGAIGNDAADDTAALATAFAAGAGGSVFIPEGIYRHTTALTIPNDTWIYGAGAGSVLKTLTLVSGGAGFGHRQLDATNKTRWKVSDLTLDAGAMTGFTTGMRTILASASTYYEISNVRFRTPGAAVASLGSSHFWITDNDIEIVASDGVAHHDGVIDQWAGSHNFVVRNNVIRGNNIAKYGVLVTGEATDGTAAAINNFTVTGNRVLNAKLVGIWVNGRDGIATHFTIADNIIRNVSDFFGIAVADARSFTVSSNVIDTTAYSGIRLYQEATFGVTACTNGTVTGNIVANANMTAAVNDAEGSAISVLDQSANISLTGNHVSGTTHRYAVYFAPTTANCELLGSNFTAGVVGNVAGGAITNRVPGGGTYTPTLTGIANVTSSTARTCRFRRDGDVVTVSGRVEITPSVAASTVTQLGISLPVASNLTDNTADLAGVGASPFGVVAAISPDTTNERAHLQFLAPNTSSNIIYFTFQYAIR